MATATPELPPMPPPNVPLVKLQTDAAGQQVGLVDEYWYRWLKTLETIVRGLRTEV